MILYRDPSEVHEAFARAFGDRFADSGLWPLPMAVEYKLFNDPNFVTSAQYALALFDASLPLLPTRMAQLTGDIARSIESYGTFRFAERPLQNDGETPIPPPVQALLDLYATYYLALGKLDQGRPDDAERFFRQTLRMTPEPGPNQAYVTMFRWGAHTNLGLLCEARGDRVEAIRHYAAGQPTFQDHGNRLRAQALIWADPFDPDTPPAAPPRSTQATTASAAQPAF
jgi:tetratricopeptide (TPR) repeat protein